MTPSVDSHVLGLVVVLLLLLSALGELHHLGSCMESSNLKIMRVGSDGLGEP